MRTVVIIGGGAAGMMAALSASENPENRIILLERQQRVGRKLLATGNGRCNLTNTGAAPCRYHGEDASFAQRALELFPPERVLDFFKSLGLLCTEEHGGRVYPLSNSANSVVDVLRFALERENIELRCSCPARKISRHGEGFCVKTDEGDILADSLIVACGGAAGAKLGGVSDGYELLKELGHKRTKLMPALVQLICEPSYPRALKGVRTQARLRLLAGTEMLAESRGELQFTETGLSGPAAFDISRASAFCGTGARVEIDLLPDQDDGELLRLLQNRTRTMPRLKTEDILTGVLHNRLGKMLVKYTNLPAAGEIKTLSEAQLRQLVSCCHAFSIELYGVESFDTAQVTAGGIKTGGVNPETMESWFVPKLFICGELLDIDGDCGGFNLQWAWASGYIAGRLGK